MPSLFRGITSNNNGDSYCLKCFCSHKTKHKLKRHKKAWENHDYCHVEMPEEDNKILKHNIGEKSMKVPFTIYTDLEFLLGKMNTCHNNPEKPSTNKMNKHRPSGNSLFTYRSFDTTKNNFDYNRGKNCMKNLCLDLKEHATQIINYQKKEVIPLTRKRRENA